LLRCLADFDNYKKRSAAERSEVIKFSNELFVLELLPIIDNFERAIKASEEGHPIEEITKGVALVKRQFLDTFKKMGVEEIESIGKKFDPHFHEAVMSKEDKSKEDHTVLEEMQKGYTFHGKLIRPAMVIVSKK
jgi:molecular chaperone GrpE